MVGLHLQVGLAGCGPQGPVRTALVGDLSTLQSELKRAEAKGELDKPQVQALARAVAEREVVSATGASGVQHVRALAGCGSQLLDAFRKRSEQHDAPGAEALRARWLQNDLNNQGAFRRYRQDPDPNFRAIAALVVEEPKDRVQRRAWFLDPDERVRQGALESALRSPEAYDLDALLEAFRLEPAPQNRSLAARAVGAIGGEAAVLGLKDRFERADEQGRLTIVEAWATPASFKAGGERELRLLVEAKHGLVSLAAIDAIRRQQVARDDGALVGFLLTALRDGSEDEQRLAIQYLPFEDARVLPALRAASKHENPEVRVMTLARLLGARSREHKALDEELKRAAAEARKQLTELAQGKDQPASEAMASLAASGDVTVAPRLVAVAQKGEAWERSRAAIALFRLGKYAAAAHSLADRDPGVRIRTACGILLQTQ